MAMITISFNYPDTPLPKYKFGDRVAISDCCQPSDWVCGKVIGMILEETYHPGWWYSVKLDAPAGYTEEYLESDLVAETEIATRQTEWEEEAALVVEDSQKISPKFQPGMLVRFTKESGCNLLGGFAKVVDSRYVSSEDWSGFVYKLTNDRLSEAIEIGEPWLQPIASTTKADANQGLAEKERG